MSAPINIEESDVTTVQALLDLQQQIGAGNAAVQRELGELTQALTDFVETVNRDREEAGKKHDECQSQMLSEISDIRSRVSVLENAKSNREIVSGERKRWANWARGVVIFLVGSGIAGWVFGLIEGCGQ